LSKPDFTPTLEAENEVQMIEKVIRIDRVNKVVKGGKRLAFRAFVITGDQNGNVSFGLGKSKEVPVAIKKSIDRANKSLTNVQVVEGTVPHEVIGEYGSSRVIIKPAKPGTGVIAGGAVRILLEAAGYKNVVSKVLGSRNAINATKAALQGLQSLKVLEEEQKIRGKKLPVFIQKLEEENEPKKAPVKKEESSDKKEKPKKKAAPKKASKAAPKKKVDKETSDKKQEAPKADADQKKEG
jgi:small subunit ribosomal protein S5